MSENIEYIVIRRKIKNVYICVREGQVIVKVPLKFSETKIKELVSQKEEWIKKKLNKNRENRTLDLRNKNYIYILGNKVNINYIYKECKNINIKLTENYCEICIPRDMKLNDNLYEKIELKLDKALKEIAKVYIISSMYKYIKMTSLEPKKIKIRKFRSIWGNCSSNKVIKINQNLVHYGIEQIEYVCLHELTHLKYMNHQKEFWNFISKYMPNYKEISKMLKQ